MEKMCLLPSFQISLNPIFVSVQVPPNLQVIYHPTPVWPQFKKRAPVFISTVPPPPAQQVVGYYVVPRTFPQFIIPQAPLQPWRAGKEQTNCELWGGQVWGHYKHYKLSRLMSGLSTDLLGPKGLAVQFNYSFHNLKKNLFISFCFLHSFFTFTNLFFFSFFFVNDGYYSAQGYPTAQVKTAL